MIKVNLKENSIIIKGHANYDTYGNDIVCASVSCIVYTTINAILNFNKEAIKYKDQKDLMQINIFQNDDITQKLINNMVTLLEDLQKQYPKNIKISKGE